MIDFHALNWAGPSGLRDRLSVLIDPRQRRGIRFPLEEFLLLAPAAILAGQRSYLAISDWIHDLSPEYRERFGSCPWGSRLRFPVNRLSAGRCRASTARPLTRFSMRG